MQQSPLKMTNKFEILASMTDFEKDNNKKVTYDTSDHTLKGNKNKTWPTLGKICHRKNSNVDFLTSWKAIKTKLGLNWVIPHMIQIKTLSIGNRQVSNSGATKTELGLNWELCLVITMTMS